MPGDSAILLCVRITVALNQLRAARIQGDPVKELEEQTELDNLLDAYPRKAG